MTKHVAIVGAGLSGLTCARTLLRAGVDVTVVEASDGIGGRVRTDEVDGFLLDRGFQVFLDSYPEARTQLDLGALDLRAFNAGALVRRGSRMHVVADPVRQPVHAVSSLVAPVGSIADKLRVARLRQQLLAGKEDHRFRAELATGAALEAYGFSERMMRTFFEPFLGGVFLERQLETSAAKFQFVFRMFSTGRATVPAGGMSRIPEQIAQELEGRVRTGRRVSGIREGTLTLESGETIEADAIVIAVDQVSAARILRESVPVRSRAATTVYFDAPEPPVEGPWLVLNGDADGLVNHLAVMSEVCPEYAPRGRALVSVTMLLSGISHPEERVRRELEGWFGSAAREWRHLRTCQTLNALPEERSFSRISEVRRAGERVWQCGDYLGNASIDGAMLSGRLTAEAVMEEL